MFQVGFFHGDPHPGNVLVRRDGSFAFLDCGITGELSYDQRKSLRGFVENLAFERFAESAIDYTRLCRITAATDVDAWIYDLATNLAKWRQALGDRRAVLVERHMGSLQAAIALAMRRHRVQTLPNQILVWRALVLMDTTLLRLPFRFDVLSAMESFFRRGERRAKILNETVGELMREGPLFAHKLNRQVDLQTIHMSALIDPGPRREPYAAAVLSVLAVACAGGAHAFFSGLGLAASCLCVLLIALAVWCP
jgi:ubiquinone biosynthesis protein